MDNYILGSVIGEGQFGSVRKATVKQSGAHVAMKQIRLNRTTEGLPHPVAREILLAPSLESPFIIRTIEVLPFGSSVVMVMELCKADLGNLLRAHSYTNPLPPEKAKNYLQMLLMALHYLHKRDILHRDVKPSNLFLCHNGVLKVGDFGLSRIRAEDMSHEVSSRWYRAPELLFGCRTYGGEVDMWSVGCVFGELLRGFSAPLFTGDGDLNQLSRIFDVLGTPKEESLRYYEQLPDWGKVHFHEKQGSTVRSLFPTVPDTAVHLLERLLNLNPKERLTPQEALSHPYFCSA
ncbi:protein kinase [Angomonas deanei]|uniref:[RNA-polymerase]-subunit kinase n=1 Tax=Angomonas deanei TaxID=59799 RepID=S9VT22_9TRYP|nr:protein kinase [Angomonas deanei]EPY26365.1 protein kinase [Angomonas deanei]CAD2215918.1 Protein tyrosine kinase/Protein kinase domain containing protein, putative [Angomonas deanei]|eukprot:EPY26318.1 protein kinase [Angomonas deanei]